MTGNVDSGVAIYKDGQLLEGSFRLSSEATVYQAELVAIVKSLELLNSCDVDALEDISVYSDSMPSIQALSNSSSTDPLVATVHARRAEKRIRWFWVKAHIGT